MKLHALTLSWNGLPKLNKLYPGLMDNFNSLLKSEKELTDCLWHLRDNGSKDETVKQGKEWNSTIIYDVGHNRDNFAKCVNYLFKEANPQDDDFILLLNNDVVFPDKVSLRELFYVYNKTKADVVGCKLLYENTNKLQHAGVIFSDKYGRMPFHFRPGEDDDFNASKHRYFQSVTAACCLVKVRAFRQVNGMNESFFWAFEDIDMCLKIGQLKKNNIAYCGTSFIYHEESASLKKNPVNKMHLNNNVSLFQKIWFGKYKIDHDDYLKNSNYNLIK
jgi:GT2 family glycosyltransferase